MTKCQPKEEVFTNLCLGWQVSQVSLKKNIYIQLVQNAFLASYLIVQARVWTRATKNCLVHATDLMVHSSNANSRQFNELKSSSKHKKVATLQITRCGTLTGASISFIVWKSLNLYSSVQSQRKRKGRGKITDELFIQRGRSYVWSSSLRTRKLYQLNQQVYVGHKIGKHIIRQAPRKATGARNNNLHSTWQAIWTIWTMWAHWIATFGLYLSLFHFSAGRLISCRARRLRARRLRVDPQRPSKVHGHQGNQRVEDICDQWPVAWFWLHAEHSHCSNLKGSEVHQSS